MAISIVDEGTRQKIKAIDRFLRNPRRMRATVLVALALAGLWAYSTLGDSIQSKRRHARSAQERNVLLQELKSLESTLDIVNESFPIVGGPTIDIGWWLDTLYQAAPRFGLEIERVNPEMTGLTVASLDIVRLSGEAQGTYANIVKFLHHIETIRPAVRMDRFSIQGAAALGQAGEENRILRFSVYAPLSLARPGGP